MSLYVRTYSAVQCMSTDWLDKRSESSKGGVNCLQFKQPLMCGVNSKAEKGYTVVPNQHVSQQSVSTHTVCVNTYEVQDQNVNSSGNNEPAKWVPKECGWEMRN